MKKIIITVIALTTFTTQAQTNTPVIKNANQADAGMFLDLHIGTRFGGIKSDNVTLGSGLNLEGGIGYMFNNWVGIKGDLSVGTIKTVEVSSLGSEDKSGYIRLGLHGLFDIASLADFGISNFSLIQHTGFGLATISNPSWKENREAAGVEFKDPLIKGNDDVFTLVFGLTPKYKINEHIALNLDFSFNLLMKQDHTFDRFSYITTGGGTTNFSTLSLGMTYFL